jgi:hypothetical protein
MRAQPHLAGHRLSISQLRKAQPLEERLLLVADVRMTARDATITASVATRPQLISLVARSKIAIITAMPSQMKMSVFFTLSIGDIEISQNPVPFALAPPSDRRLVR